MDVSILERPLYSISQAARFLFVPPASLRRWLEGYKAGDEIIPPVIRPIATGSNDVTWAEFVEAGFLREYRSRRVSLQRMRPFIEAMRVEAGVPFPLAHFKPMIDPKRDLMVWLKQIQDDVQLDDALSVVNVVTGELAFGKPMEQFLDKVDFEDQVAVRMYPLGRTRSSVVIDPQVSFGIPQIAGVRAELIAEAIATGDRPESIARIYGLTLDQVDDAIRWELNTLNRSGAVA